MNVEFVVQRVQFGRLDEIQPFDRSAKSS